MTYKIVLPDTIAEMVSQAVVAAYSNDGLKHIDGVEVGSQYTELTMVFNHSTTVVPDDLEWLALHVAKKVMQSWVRTEIQRTLLN